MQHTFEHSDGNSYEFAAPAVIFNKKRYTAEELLQEENAAIRAELVDHTWKGRNGQRRDEESYAGNGILKLVLPEPEA